MEFKQVTHEDHLAEARRVLQRPVFGDPKCMLAARALRDEEEAKVLRKRIVGKQIVCLACDGYGNKCTCTLCQGSGKYTITDGQANAWDLDQVKSALCEIDGY